MPLGIEVGLSQADFVLDGDPALPPQKGSRAPSPVFGPCSLWPNCWMDQDGTWHKDGPWSRPHCARWGPSSPPQKGQPPPKFSAHVHCGQMAGWIKMVLDTEVVGLGPGHNVLDGDPAPLPQKGAEPPILAHFYCGQTAGWIKMPLGMAQTRFC